MRRFAFAASFVAVLAFLANSPLVARGPGGGHGGGGHGANSAGDHGGGPHGSGQNAEHGNGGRHENENGAGKQRDGDGRHDDDQGAGNHERSDGHLNQNKNGLPATHPGGVVNNSTSSLSKQQQLLIDQRNRDHKLSQAQHLREIARRNGNPNLLANADRMEAEAKEQYARRLAQLEKFGVTDPTVTPGAANTALPGSVANQLLPSGGPTPPAGLPTEVARGLDRLIPRPLRP